MSVIGDIGTQVPRIYSHPAYVASSGAEAFELAESAGLLLDPWQAFVLEHALGERSDGRWSAFETGLVVSRQNGKGSLLEARCLAGLFLFGERLIVWSAHLFDTSLEAFRRMLELVEGTPEFSRRVKRISKSHGEEGIELYGEGARRQSGGQRIRFRTRTKGGGRGFSGDLVILDEAMKLPESTIGALMPILSARPNPQIWYTGSAVDQLKDDDGRVLAKIRARGIAGDDPSLAYFEWSLDRDTPDDVDLSTAASENSWAEANPALGIRIDSGYVANEQRSMDARTFAVERLGVGDWPRTDGAESVVDMDVLDALIDFDSTLEDPVWFAIDVSPDRARSSISAAGTRPDGLYHGELIARKPGTGWIAERAASLQRAHSPRGFLIDERGPASSLLPELLAAGVTVETIDSQAYARACSFLLDVVNQARFRHLGQPELRSAIRGASTRSLGDAWAWSRRNSHVDISPLVSVTLALWGFGRDAGSSGFETW